MITWAILAGTMPSPLPAGGTPESGPDLSWIPDVLAILVSLLAAFYAHRANTIAKKAPAEARLTATRDELRDALFDAKENMRSVGSDLSNGKEVPKVATELNIARAATHRLQDRLPERDKVRQLEFALDSLEHTWHSAHYEQDQVKFYETQAASEKEKVDRAHEVKDTEYGERHKRSLGIINDALGNHSRARDAKTADLRTRLKDCTVHIENYLSTLNASDRTSVQK